MNASQLETYLLEIFNDHLEDGEIRDFETFENEGILTNNSGIVLYMNDGTQFQLKITQAK